MLVLYHHQELINQDEDILINLQPSVVDGELSQLEKLGFKVINCCDCKKDIDTVFQLITICSKVITVANSVAHFAGALGKKTILWLPEYPTWRWGQDMVASDLYPSIELKDLKWNVGAHIQFIGTEISQCPFRIKDFEIKITRYQINILIVL